MWLYIYQYREKDDIWIYDRTVPSDCEWRAKERLKEIEKLGHAGAYTPELIPGAYY